MFYTDEQIQEQHSQLVETSFKHMDGRGKILELLHATVGLVGEAGEFTDAIKKCWAYEKMLDVTNAIEELGDIEYYLEAIRQNLSERCGIDISRRLILDANLSKLRKRYPGEVFSNAAAVARIDKIVHTGEGQKRIIKGGSLEWTEAHEANIRAEDLRKTGGGF